MFRSAQHDDAGDVFASLNVTMPGMFRFAQHDGWGDGRAALAVILSASEGSHVVPSS